MDNKKQEENRIPHIAYQTIISSLSDSAALIRQYDEPIADKIERIIIKIAEKYV